MDNQAQPHRNRNSIHRGAGELAGRSRHPKRSKTSNVRTRVSRACDRCKARKTRCSGRFPCVFCAQLNLECRFTAAYRRGQLPAIAIDTSHNAYPIDAISPPLSSARVPEEDPGSAGGTSDEQRPWPSVSNEEGRRPSLLTVDQDMRQDSPGRRLGSTNRTVDEDPSISVPQSSRNSPERTQTDQQGHYVGPASSVSFLLRIQKKLQQQSSGSSSSSIFTFGDLPLPGGDVSFAILPPKPQAVDLVRRYFDLASATHRFCHRPTIEAWLDEMYMTSGAMLDPEAAPSRTALLFMIFAIATNFTGRESRTSEVPVSKAIEASARYFSVAEHQLSREKGKIRLTSVQARLAQCFYLLTHSRLNHCWTLFGITAHLVLALGIHRKSRVEIKASGGNTDHIDLECRKRTFWCAYTLNAYLSAALGRPMTFHDEDIDQELPVCVDDSQLGCHQLSVPSIVAPSILSAPVAQHKLSRIVVKILRSIYGIHPPSIEQHFHLAEKFTKQLEDWWKDMSFLLDSDGDLNIFVPLVLRQRDVLKLAFWHALVLIHRPFLLNTFASLANYSANRRRLSSRKPQLERNTQRCLDAAMKIVQLIDRMNGAGQFFSTLFFIPYYGFSAVVVLYVYAIQQRWEAPETYIRYFEAASRCHHQIESIAIKGSLTQRYGVVLQEMRLEVLRNNDFLATATTPEAGGTIVVNSNSLSEHEVEKDNTQLSTVIPNANQTYDSYQPVPNSATVQRSEGAPSDPHVTPSNRMGTTYEGEQLLFGDTEIGDSLAQMTGWGQFDSLVTGGTDGLETIFMDSAFDSLFM
ncbi:fungal-specific transcription factor domain-containing protein [Stachybotrys elegans]|uniref:Fungal-specific transcription factor domain-containing protein n=1 Tax=Stachybotrys elegans TaxID=80388 RepID=A0A8K0SK19_9HYPO|nr:fungal-specific transcription factor domain-containing protein [Stachybotrys elegans]